MQGFSTLFNQQLCIYLLMACGFLLCRLNIIPVEGRKTLTDLLIDFVLPCNIIVSFMVEFSFDTLRSCLAVFLVSVCIQVFAFFAGHLFYPGTGPQQKPILRYGTMVSNATFLGMPVVEVLFGQAGLLYASIFLIPQRTMMWSTGITCFTGARGKGVAKKVLTHPCIVAVFIGLFFMITQISLPGPVYQAMKYVSNCNTALCMVMVGHLLTEVDPKSVITPWNLWFCVVRLVIMPLLVMGGCRLMGLDSLVTGVSTVLAGMPAAATIAILANQYKCNEQFAVSMVFVSTVLSLFTIPLLVTIIGL